MPNFNLSEKIRKSSFQVLQILAIFWNLIALTLGYNSVKALVLLKLSKKKKNWRDLGQVRFKKGFQKQ